MNKQICAKCQSEYERISEFDSGICKSCQIKNEIKVYEALPTVFSTFGFIFIGMFLPFLILPLVNGMEGDHYIMSKKKGILRITPFGLLMLNAFNVVLIIIFFRLSAYFKQKLVKVKEQSSDLLQM